MRQRHVHIHDAQASGEHNRGASLSYTPPTLATMSAPPLAPIFSAAHVSKWDALPEDTVTLTRAAWSKLELKRTTGPMRVSGQSNDADHNAYTPSESSKPGGSVFSTRECEISVRVAASVSSTVETEPSTRRSTKSRGTYLFFFYIFCFREIDPPRHFPFW